MSPDTRGRLVAIDALRGLVIVLMALDHARDFFHAGAMTSSPTDLTQTTSVLFLTRWVTHLCAPTFALLAGVGAWLRLQRPGETRASLSRYLVSRGLGLVLLELLVMRLAMNFSWSMAYPPLLLVLWMLGLSMIALAALAWLPARVLLWASVVVIVGHNGLDGVRAADLGHWAGLWRVLHEPGVLPVGGVIAIVGYPVIPWVAVMAAGFGMGPLFELPSPLREPPPDWRRSAALWGVPGGAVGQRLRRPGTVELAADAHVHRVVVPEHHEVPAVARVPADDTWSRIAPAGVDGAARAGNPSTLSSCSVACRCSSTSATSGRCTRWRR